MQIGDTTIRHFCLYEKPYLKRIRSASKNLFFSMSFIMPLAPVETIQDGKEINLVQLPFIIFSRILTARPRSFAEKPPEASICLAISLALLFSSKEMSFIGTNFLFSLFILFHLIAKKKLRLGHGFVAIKFHIIHY